MLIIISIYDIFYNKIRNLHILSIIIFSIFYMAVLFGFNGTVFVVTGFIFGLLLLSIPYALGGMAAGDVKLMGAVGAALGPYGVIIAFLYSAIAGGIYALILMLTGRAGDFPRRLWNTLRTFYYTRQFSYDKPQRPDQQVKLCYGVAIAAGTILYIVLEMTGKGQLVRF
jgi:prepilin peptidase CpaA